MRTAGLVAPEYKAFALHRAFLLGEWLLLALLSVRFVTGGFLPGWRNLNTDFSNYYLAASIVREGTPLDRAYEWRWFQRQKDYRQIEQKLVSYSPHPPMCALPLLPLTSMPPLSAKHIWLLCNLAFLTLVLWILRRNTQLPWRRLLLLTFLCVLPLRQDFLYGQYYTLILLLLCLAYEAARRGHHYICGAVLASAASLKIFPALFLVLFLRQRNWRAAAGLVFGGIVLAATSVAVFGWNVHKVYLLEVLPRAMHGDLVGPYVLQWNSFTALCHRLFLAEPELNPAPLLNSTVVYSFVQGLLATVLLFSFLFRTDGEASSDSAAWQWASFLPLLILLSSMPTAYHHVILIFTAVVAIDKLQAKGDYGSSVTVGLLYGLACFPLPKFLWLNLQMRFLAELALFVFLLYKTSRAKASRFHSLGVVLVILFFVLVSFSNLRSLRGRSADFYRRLPPVNGYATFSVARGGDRLIVDEMTLRGFTADAMPGANEQPMPGHGDVLSIAANSNSPFVYFELTNRLSTILRVPVTGLGDAVPEYFAEGHDIAISPDGHWVACLRGTGRAAAIWLLSQAGSPETHDALRVVDSEALGGILEMTVLPDGNIIAATGSAANPHLTLLEAARSQIHPLTEIRGAVRYPAASLDGTMLAFSRRESGSWHLFVRDLASGTERQLTSAACNATSPSWENTQTLLYVTDCGRGLGLGAATTMPVPSLPWR